MNIIAADCGFDPALIERFEDITVEFIRNDNGVDLTGHRNMHISLAAESGDVTINDFECMIPGVDYTIVCSNDASTKFQSTLSEGRATANISKMLRGGLDRFPNF